MSSEHSVRLGVNRSETNGSFPVPQEESSSYSGSDGFPQKTFASLSGDSSELLFRDGYRQIDMILAFDSASMEKHKIQSRINFERNLLKDGLHLELEDKDNSSGGDIYFLKIHAPWDVLARYAEAVGLKMPLKVDENESVHAYGEPRFFKLPNLLQQMVNKAMNTSVRNDINVRTSFLTAPFVRTRAENFAIESKETFFLPSQRSMLVWHILCHTSFSRRRELIGIKKLLRMGAYTAAFPLHDGDVDSKILPTPIRKILYEEWGSFSSWYRPQPLPLVRDYFGDKIGIYFAWLGFYTIALIPPAIVGFLCFLYGASTLNSKNNVLSDQICNNNTAGRYVMCPLCDEVCPYWFLGDSCTYSKVSYLFDNYATCFFAVFMSIWATTYLELWKRKQARLAWEWDLLDREFGEDEEVRLEYQLKAKDVRISPVTRKWEPYIPRWKHNLRRAASGIGVSFICLILLTVMLIVIVYRLAIVTVFARLGPAKSTFLRQNAKLIASISAAFINLVIITSFKFFANRIIIALTEFEAPRTQTEFEDSYIFKIFIFDFINVYSSLIYIAIFKGRFFTHPGDLGSSWKSKSTYFDFIKTDVCDPSGCFFELCIQLAIIMVGRQLVNNFMEIVLPKMRNWWRSHRAFEDHENISLNKLKPMTRWEKDYMLQPMDTLSFYEEYHEVVIQYGLITLFVAAFPLAPFFAILNNIIEIRVDTYKIVTQFRRPVAQRVANKNTIIHDIMQVVTYLAVVSNAFVIAYSSEFIPRLVYYYINQFSLEGYLNFTISKFNTSFYQEGMKPMSDVDSRNMTQCYYRAMRNPSEDLDEPHDYSINFWYTTVCRLAFVVVFEHIVFAITGLIAYAIPDVPSSVRDKQIRERLLEREALVSYDSDLTAGTAHMHHSDLLSAVHTDENELTKSSTAR